MKKFFVIFLVLAISISFIGLAGAEFPFWFGPPNPFIYPMPYWGAFSIFPLIRPMSPLLSLRGLTPGLSLPAVVPPRPMIRQARATVTILFNPTLSVIQVTVLPLSPTIPTAPILPPPTALAPTGLLPVLPPTAVLFLPLLSALGGTQPNTNLNSVSTVSPATPIPVVNSTTPALTGLSALLPLI